MDIIKSVNLRKAGGSTKPATEVTSGKDVICFYFSAHWCPPCRAFTPVLKEFYEEVEGIEIIFVSSDRSPADMEAYMKESHGDWWGVEHGSSAVEALKSHFGIRGIPALIVVDKNGDVITKDGRADVQSKGPGVVAQWKKGKV